MTLVDLNPKRECPACAMESTVDNETCPFCGYEFPEMPTSHRWWAWIFVLLLLWPAILLIKRYIL